MTTTNSITNDILMAAFTDAIQREKEKQEQQQAPQPKAKAKPRKYRVYITYYYYPGTFYAPKDGWARWPDGDIMYWDTRREADEWVDEQISGVYILHHGEYEAPSYRVSSTTRY